MRRFASKCAEHAVDVLSKYPISVDGEDQKEENLLLKGNGTYKEYRKCFCSVPRCCEISKRWFRILFAASNFETQSSYKPLQLPS